MFPFKKLPSAALPAVYIANILLAFHWGLIIYINSSFLERFIGAEKIGIIYTVSSLISLFIFLSVSKFIKQVGTYPISIFFIIAECIAITGLILSSNVYVIVPLFILHTISVPMILFTLDIFLEGNITDESKTGGLRSLFLTLSNTALVLSPLIFGLIIHNNEFGNVYLLSVLFLIPLFFLIVKFFRHFEDTAEVVHTKLLQTVVLFVKNKNIFNIFKAHLLLQFFYAWMIIYMPIHLVQNIGFNWAEIGMLFSIMLLPFILFEIPLGQMADKRTGEKEILIAGIFITALSVAVIPFISTPNFFLWAIILFTTRTGASFVEIATESYFFKQVNGSNGESISFFRLTRPLSFIMAPIVATFALLFMPFEATFFVLSIIIMWGATYAFPLVDSK